VTACAQFQNGSSKQKKIRSDGQTKILDGLAPRHPSVASRQVRAAGSPRAEDTAKDEPLTSHGSFLALSRPRRKETLSIHNAEEERSSLEEDLVLGRPREVLVREDDARADVDLLEDRDVLACAHKTRPSAAVGTGESEREEDAPRMAMLCLSPTSGAPSTRDHGPSLHDSPIIEYRTHEFFCRRAKSAMVREESVQQSRPRRSTERERTHVEEDVVEEDRLLDPAASGHLDAAADRDVGPDLGRRVDLGVLVDEARLDNLGALVLRVVGARLGEDGRRAAAQERGVGRLVRREDEGVGGDGRAVERGARVRASRRRRLRQGDRDARGALDLDPGRRRLEGVEPARVREGREDVLLEAELLVAGRLGVVAASGVREFSSATAQDRRTGGERGTHAERLTLSSMASRIDEKRRAESKRYRPALTVSERNSSGLRRAANARQLAVKRRKRQRDRTHFSTKCLACEVCWSTTMQPNLLASSRGTCAHNVHLHQLSHARQRSQVRRGGTHLDGHDSADAAVPAVELLELLERPAADDVRVEDKDLVRVALEDHVAVVVQAAAWSAGRQPAWAAPSRRGREGAGGRGDAPGGAEGLELAQVADREVGEVARRLLDERRDDRLIVCRRESRRGSAREARPARPWRMRTGRGGTHRIRRGGPR